MSARFPRSRPPPKAYTQPQLTFLKSYLPEYERRSLGPIRGDAKKFALERAAEFVNRFGLPEDVDLGEDADARFREQLYNWFKNTVGRNRRKAEGKPRSPRKASEKASQPRDPWEHNSNDASPALNRDYPHPESSSSSTVTGTYAENTPTVTPSPTVPARIPVQYIMPSTLANALQPSPSPPPPPARPVPVTVASLKDAFLSNVEPPVLASQIQTFVMANPSPLALKPVVSALFQAISTDWDKNSTPPNQFLTRFLGAAQYFTSAVMHAGISGPMAGPRALHMQIRKSAKWIPTSAVSPRPTVPVPAPSSLSSNASSMSLELHRITLDRARRKEHIQWARIHAAALEVGAFTFLHNPGVDGTYEYGESRVFSYLVAHDALWEDDEVEWVAGVIVLQALIRTSMRGDTAKRRQYEELLLNYEERWKEMKDETRQAMVTEALLAAKTDLARLGP
ncbi:hypothetical protein GGX14DRAFT_33405 [Mycena pura]|uniref:Uncharacterized protein n=1 Tax=Mycena pura TaxID=153505 RepID=A0AAD6VNZ3_9AGAR|nr:hypothetical protein GGX14DRAFT_33405 [Mycena pura]